jgi:nitrogen fixation protein NifU and related proteins
LAYLLPLERAFHFIIANLKLIFSANLCWNAKTIFKEEEHAEGTDSMSLTQLYQEIIMEHSQEPRNFSKLVEFTHEYEGYNPLCGDRVLLQAQIVDGTIKNIGFQGEGCSICMASASMMSEEVLQKNVAESLDRVQWFRDLMQDAPNTTPPEGDLQALEGVKRFPVRIKCALLPWITLKDCIEKKNTSKEMGT